VPAEVLAVNRDRYLRSKIRLACCLAGSIGSDLVTGWTMFLYPVTFRLRVLGLRAYGVVLREGFAADDKDAEGETERKCCDQDTFHTEVSYKFRF